MIASEPITFESSDWMEVKTNTMVVITPKVRDQIPLQELDLIRHLTASSR
jgi:glutamine amidotransferase